MNRQRITIMAAAVCVIVVGICYLSWRNYSGTSVAAEKNTKEIRNVDNLKKEKKNYSKKERRDRKIRRGQAIAKAMKMMAERVEPPDQGELQRLIEESQISEEELKFINVRNGAIKPYLRAEGPSMYDAMISEENQDLEWTRENNEIFRKIIEEPDYSGSELVDLKCYENICKGVFIHSSEDAMMSFDSHPQNPASGGGGQGFLTRHDNGPVDVTVFFSRTGNNGLFKEEMYDRLYKKITGQSVDDIEL